MAEISDEWASVLQCYGTAYVMECHCGITHFCDKHVMPGSWQDDDDLEYYEKLSNEVSKGNKKYVYHGESIGSGEIDGKQLVIGCPCGGDLRYEQFIWQHKEMISRYLNARIMRELEDKTKEFSDTCVTPTADLLERIESTMQNAMENFKKLVHGTD